MQVAAPGIQIGHAVIKQEVRKSRYFPNTSDTRGYMLHLVLSLSGLLAIHKHTHKHHIISILNEYY